MRWRIAIRTSGSTRAPALELNTTRCDLNRQAGVGIGEYLGIRLSELGFTGREDFIISVEMPDIPGLERVGQFGLYAGASGSRAVRGGAAAERRELQPVPGQQRERD